MADQPLKPEIRERLEIFLRRRGLRMTKQREVILRAAFGSNEHFTAEELWDEARKLDRRTSRATVYRTIALLREGGLLREIDLGRDQKVFDPNFLDHPHHNHLVCIDCGKVIEFEDSHMRILEECITRRLGFRSTQSSLRIEACCDRLRQEGVCPNLLQKRLGGGRAPRRKESEAAVASV